MLTACGGSGSRSWTYLGPAGAIVRLAAERHDAFELATLRACQLDD